MKGLDFTGDPFHSEWNYTIRPRQPTSQQPVNALQLLRGVSFSGVMRGAPFL